MNLRMFARASAPALLLTLGLSACGGDADDPGPVEAGRTRIAAATDRLADASGDWEVDDGYEDDGYEDDGSPSGEWQVTLTGSVRNQPFERTATLRVVPVMAEVGTTNGVNPVDVCLISGSPAAVPEVGAVALNSNAGCNPGASAARTDLAQVSVVGTMVTVEFDDLVAATYGNVFTASDSAIWACPYAPNSGTLTVDTATGSGTIEINGYSGGCGGSAGYSATF